MSSNYSIWKWKIWDLLYCKDLFKLVKGMTKPKGMSDDDGEILHTKVVATVKYWVDHNIFHHIFKETKVDVYDE